MERHPISSCYYCAGKSFFPLYPTVYDKLGVSQQAWSFVRCDGCGAALLSPHPAAEALAELYPKCYTFPTPSSEGPLLKRILINAEYWMHRRWTNILRARIVMRLMGVSRGDGLTMLDIACGSGDFMREMSLHGFTVEGVDWNAEASVAVQKERGITVKAADATQLAGIYPPASFDLVTAFNIIEHVLNPSECLKQWASLLKPNGMIIFGCPAIDGPTARWFGERNNNVTEAPRHVSLPTQSSIRSLTNHTGLTLTTITAESVLECSSGIALSLISSSEVTNSRYLNRPSPMAIILRAAMGMIAYSACPWIWFENKVLQKPFALIVAVKNS